jgi:hypothetical protein
MMRVSLERNAVQTLLGIRFWDPLFNASVAQGLNVKAQRLSQDLSHRLGKAVVGQLTPRGVVAFFGLTSEELVDADPDRQIWKTVPPSTPVVIDVADWAGRFLPMSFLARLPFRGVFPKQSEDWLSGPSILRLRHGESDGGIGIRLWSAPARSVPSGLALVRGSMLVYAPKTEKHLSPAAYALVEVSFSSNQASLTYFGMTDQNGNLLLAFSYPPIPEPKPEAETYTPFDALTFDLKVTVYYDNTQSKLAGSTVPKLDTILQQKAARIIRKWRSKTSEILELVPDVPMSQKLHFDTPLILRTEDDDQQNFSLLIQTTGV